MKNVTGKHFVLTLCLVFCMVMFAAGAVAEQREVATAAELKAALADTACDRIVVTADFSVSESMKITNPSVNIDLGGHTLTATELTAGYNLFDVGEGKTLNLSNGTLKSSHEGANAGFRAVLGRSGSSVELDSLTIEKFGGVYAGGAVLAYGNSLKVNECTIQGCGANVGGAIATYQLNETVLTGNMLADNYTQAGMGNIEIPDPVNHPDETVVLDMEDIARDLSPFSGTNSGCGGALGYVSRYNGALRMEGNTIQNNRAENRGGGIYFYAPNDNNTIDLTSGSFLGNSAKWGGAIDYSNHLQTALQLNNVLITENKAARGGGVWICPQSALNIAYNLSGSIYGNTASGTVQSYYGNILDAAGDDICVEGNDSEDIPRTGGMSYESGTVVNVIGRGLGGVETRWYVDSADKRYAVQPEEADESLYFNMTNSFALHGEVDPELIGLIESEARLVFRGNTATERGGAIASNSPLNIGASEYPTVFVTVRKAFKGLDNTEDAPPVKAILYRVDASGHRELIQKDILLNKENGWYADLGELPSVYMDENGVVQHYTYSVGEETLDGYVLTDISQKKNTRITGTIKVPNETDMKNYWDSADLTVRWMKAGTEETVGEAQRMYAGNRWCVSWSVLAENFTPPSSGTLYSAKWDDNGTLRPVEEAFPMSWVIEGYEAGAQWVDAGSYIITAPPEVRRFRLQNPLKTSQAVIDNWNSIGFSPKLTVRLWQFSEDVTRYWLVDSIELNKENNWSIPAGREYDSPDSSMPIDYYPSSFVVMTPEYSESYTDQYDFTLTNEPSKVIHRAEKKWNGAEGNAVTVRLLADGEPQGESVTLSAGSWQHEWAPVEIVNADGNRREYTLEEDPVAGYSADYKDEWKNQVSVAPVPDAQLTSAAGYTAVLTRQAADTTQQEIGSVQLTADSGYQHVWNDLAYADERGNTYTYILQVHPADHPEVDAADLFALKVQNIHILRVINTELTKVTGTKTWVDGGKEHDNAAEIELVLKRTSAKAGEETVTATPAWNSNTYTYSNLPKYDSEGNEYTYTVSETPITGYTIARTGNDFTNTITGTVEVTGTKTWVDGGKEHDNAAEITLVLKRISDKAAEETVTAVPAWSENTYIYSNLPKYDEEGYEYTYSVEEEPVAGYAAEQEGNDFTNTLQIVTIDPPVEKKVSGENAPEAAFTFQMTGEQDAPMPEGSTDGQKTIEQNGPGKVEFGEIEYTEPGEWQYEIREIPGDTEGYQYDDTVWQLTVKVSAAQDGLVAEVTAAAEGKAAETAVFENVYAAAETTTPPTEAPVETDEPEPTETPAPEPTEKPEPVIPPEPTWTPNEFYFSFTKSWRGTPQDSISFTLHNPNGTVKQHRFNQRKISDTEWLYEAWLSSAADYYVVENPVEGYTTAYVNVGEHAGEKDRVYNGGTIINYDIPKTGDTAYPAFWMAMAAIGLCGIGMLVFDHRKKHLDKTAQR